MSLPCDVSLPNPGAWVATAAPYSFDFNSFQARLPARPISRNKATGPTAGMTCPENRTHSYLTCASGKRPNGTFGVRHVPQETAYCLSAEPWFNGVFRDCMKGGPNGMNAVAYGCRKKRAAHS